MRFGYWYYEFLVNLLCHVSVCSHFGQLAQVVQEVSWDVLMLPGQWEVGDREGNPLTCSQKETVYSGFLLRQLQRTSPRILRSTVLIQPLGTQTWTSHVSHRTEWNICLITKKDQLTRWMDLKQNPWTQIKTSALLREEVRKVLGGWFWRERLWINIMGVIVAIPF